MSLLGWGGVINTLQILARSGHDTGTPGFYLWKNGHQQVAGKLLAGVHDPYKAAPSPNLDVITLGDDTVRVQAENLISLMFDTPNVELKVDGNLRPLLRMLMASLLQHFKAMFLDFGGNNLVVKRISTCAHRVGWPLNMLLDYSARIEADFESQKLINIAGNNIELNALTKLVQESREEIKSLKEAMLMQLASIERLTGLVTVMSSNMLERRSPTKSPSKSRAQDEPEESASSSSSSSSSSQDAANVLRTGEALTPELNFIGALQWTPAQLVSECISQNVRLDGNAAFGVTSAKVGSVRTQKSDSNKIIQAMMKFASEEDKSKLKPVRGGDSTSTGDAIEKYKAVAQDLQKKLVQDLEDREACLPSKIKKRELEDKKKNGKGMKQAKPLTISVSSIARRLVACLKEEGEVASVKARKTSLFGGSSTPINEEMEEESEIEGEEEEELGEKEELGEEVVGR
jgi:hypothetical protein